MHGAYQFQVIEWSMARLIAYRVCIPYGIIYWIENVDRWSDPLSSQTEGGTISLT